MATTFEITADSDRITVIQKVNGDAFNHEYFPKLGAIVYAQDTNVIISYKRNGRSNELILPINNIAVPAVSGIEDAFNKIRALVYD